MDYGYTEVKVGGSRVSLVLVDITEFNTETLNLFRERYGDTTAICYLDEKGVLFTEGLSQALPQAIDLPDFESRRLEN